MSHKVHPYVYRIGVLRDWKARWMDPKNYQQNLREDIAVREYLHKKLRGASIDRIETERSTNAYSIVIHTARPGLVIGRRGEGIEEVKRDIFKILRGLRPNAAAAPSAGEIRLEVREVRDLELHAALMAANIAEQLEQRIPFRRVIKRSLDRIMSRKEVEGARIMVKGRLDGSEMARREWTKSGKLPLQTLRADVDYAYTIAYTTYGAIGVKVWIYKGEKLE